jgi:hypothetical protein
MEQAADNGNRRALLLDLSEDDARAVGCKRLLGPRFTGAARLSDSTYARVTSVLG